MDNKGNPSCSIYFRDLIDLVEMKNMHIILKKVCIKTAHDTSFIFRTFTANKRLHYFWETLLKMVY